MLNGLENAGVASFREKDRALREAKKVAFKYLQELASVDGLARQRIASQKNPPPEHSPEWDILFRKYYEEEMRKKGG